MIEIVETIEFADWIGALRDHSARARINLRLQRVRSGNPGDMKSVGGEVSEMRIDYGPGYRVYLTKRGLTFVILLYGGDKSTQRRDIARAMVLVTQV